MIDFKSWKKTKEDKHGVEMQHDKGHSMTILFKGVPLVQREALKRLPLHDGGHLKGVHRSAMEVDKPSVKSKYPKEDKRWAGESKAGEHLQREDIRPGSKQKAKDEHNRVLGEIKSMPNPKLKGLSKGGMAHYAEGSDSVSKLDAALESGIDEEVPPKSAQPQTAPATAPISTQVAPQAAASLQTAPIQGQAPDQALQGAYQQQGNILNAIQQQNSENRAALEKAHAAWDSFNASPDSQIDANKYLKNSSLPSKVSTAIGMFLGGFSVPFGGENYTQQFLDHQINRNIDAQKENYAHQKNVWGAARDLFGDEQIANNFAKSVALDQANNLIRQSALSLGTPKAAARADLLIKQNNLQKEALKDASAKEMTQKQIIYRKPRSLAETVGSVLTGGIFGMPSYANEQGEEVQGPQADNKDFKESIPEVKTPHFSVDEDAIKRSQFLGGEGNIPNQIMPGEVGAANEELGKVKQFNDKINLIHENFGDLWRHRSDANQTLKYLSSLGIHAFGINVAPPDMSTWNENSKEYFRAANRIRQELGALVGSGALTNEQAETVLTNLIREDDTPDQYKKILHQVDGNLMSTIRTPVLEKYDKIKRPKH